MWNSPLQEFSGSKGQGEVSPETSVFPKLSRYLGPAFGGDLAGEAAHDSALVLAMPSSCSLGALAQSCSEEMWTSV